MVEFISNRIIDTNGLQQRCRQYLSEYNQVILDQLKNQTQKPSSGYWFLKNVSSRLFFNFKHDFIFIQIIIYCSYFIIR